MSATPSTRRRTSVIIPAFNSEVSLRVAVDSAIAQTSSALEIIIIDDGSTDGTAAVAESYGDRVRLLKQENLGQGAARNHGLTEASGEYVAFLDADDRWDHEFLYKMERFLDHHQNAVAASCAFAAERGDGVYHGPDNYNELLEQHPDGLVLEDFFGFWAEKDHVRTGTALIRRSAIEEIGLQNPKLRISQDLEYWALLGTCGEWGLLPEVLWHGGSISFAKKTGWRRRYAARRKRTPSVELWQERVMPRLTSDQVKPFAAVRGRVASGFALSQVLGGDPKVAREIVGKYGQDFPDGLTPRLLRWGHALGGPAWSVVCLVLQVRDRSR